MIPPSSGDGLKGGRTFIVFKSVFCQSSPDTAHPLAAIYPAQYRFSGVGTMTGAGRGMVSLAEEREEQARWTARLRRPVPAYDRLVANEFDPSDAQAARTARSLAAMLQHCAQEVPHYQKPLKRGGAMERPLQVLADVPILTKLGVQDAGPALQARTLPNGDRATNWTKSSGTTGRPTRVLHSVFSSRMFALLKQREYRWFRLDPGGKFASMRLPADLPGGGRNGNGETMTRDTWPYMENFTTGPFVAANLLMPVEERIAWLREEAPDYLMSLAESLESLGLAAGEMRPAGTLEAVIAISEQLTQGMREFIERRFGAPVHQNYGLNEMGIVAGRCGAGRYHVHTEHALVEIVDDKGHACPPGRAGRIVVTGLTNFAMPLLRYDTGDLAEPVSGPCACGRTLPSFGEITGRYGRVAYLPVGTARLEQGLRGIIEKMPAQLGRDLREFQIHQYRDKRMELRLVVRATLDDTVFAYIRAEWAKLVDGPAAPLTIAMVDEIPRAPGGKSEVFTSDFMPSREGRT